MMARGDCQDQNYEEENEEDEEQFAPPEPTPL